MKRKKHFKRILNIALCLTLIMGISLLYSDALSTVFAENYLEVYRLYNPNTGEHFYTTNYAEYESLQNYGWQDEGIGWYAVNHGSPVYRLYNPNAQGGDHYYTMNKIEADWLISQGWSIDNNWAPAFYSYGNTNLYVAYNPNAQSGAHNYTTNQGEQQFLLQSGWMFGEVAWKVCAPGSGYVARITVDNDVTTDGGGEGNNPGSYRWEYADRSFDPSDLSGQTPEVDYSADVTLNGSGEDYSVHFVIAGSEEKSGQIGVALHYQAGNDYRYGQGRINVTNINFPTNSNSHGQQYYSVNTSAPTIKNGQKVRLQVKYYSSGYMQTFVDGKLVGQYSTRLTPTSTSSLHPVGWDTSTHKNRYILHFVSDTKCTVSNVKVLRKGTDVTKYGDTDPYGFNKSSYSLNGTLASHDGAAAIY